MYGVDEVDYGKEEIWYSVFYRFMYWLAEWKPSRNKNLAVVYELLRWYELIEFQKQTVELKVKTTVFCIKSEDPWLFCWLTLDTLN